MWQPSGYDAGTILFGWNLIIEDGEVWAGWLCFGLFVLKIYMVQFLFLSLKNIIKNLM